MILVHNIRLDLDYSDEEVERKLRGRLKLEPGQLLGWKIYKQSLDARRKGRIRFVFSILVELENQAQVLKVFQQDQSVRPAPDRRYRPDFVPARPAHRPVVIGTGPAGLFAGLVLAEWGLNPLILERGKRVRERARDTFKFWREGDLNPESNVQFGEGGAGTFSDGKLNTRITDRAHRDRKVLREFVRAGAPESILYLNKPHLGTLRLVKILQNLRSRIEEMGGQYRYQSKVVDFWIEEGKLRGLTLEGGETLRADQVVLAVGHSARETFQVLRQRGVLLEAKPFSIGLRIEHPQELIDRSQYGPQAGHPRLGAADYQLVHHGEKGRSVYTFCMCPGGTVLAAASELGTVVTNGMSQYERRAPNANSAVVCEVSPQDFPGGPLAGIEFQRCWERKAFLAGGENYQAPGQRVEDFLNDRPSKTFGAVQPSYQPGVIPADLREVLPGFVAQEIKHALHAFDRKIKGFTRPDAVLTGVETRTSSPVRVLRGDNFQSVSTIGLYPAGEGAGYAGGILSSAVDGIQAAEALARQIKDQAL
jgi:hypothetical protein